MYKQYVVWRRSDGRIDSSIRRMPSPWQQGDGASVTFEFIMTTDNWCEAHDRIMDERWQAELRPGAVDIPNSEFVHKKHKLIVKCMECHCLMGTSPNVAVCMCPESFYNKQGFVKGLHAEAGQNTNR